MPPRWQPEWDAEFKRLARGDLASSTEARLTELVGWGGFTSLLTPAALAVATDAGIEPIGQVVGLCAGDAAPGYIRTTRPGQGRLRLGVARRREHPGLVAAWTAMRTRALARLQQQAALLGANAVVGIAADRELKAVEDLETGQIRFSGTAVRVRSWSGTTSPVLTLASPQELWAMLRAGLQPVGIAGGFACVETLPSKATVAATMGRRSRSSTVELADLTESVYETRRLAMQRLVADARSLAADGLLGVDLELEDERARARLPGLTLSVHVLASAVRRTRRAAVRPEPVVGLADGAHA